MASVMTPPSATAQAIIEEVRLLDAQLKLATSNRQAAIDTERRDARKAFEALCAAHYPTPLEGYGTNSSWAISDLCRALALAEDRIQQLTLDLTLARGF